jgi:hypothetical protein
MHILRVYPSIYLYWGGDGGEAVHKRSRSDSQLHKLEARFAEGGPTKISPVKVKKFNTLLSQPVVDIGKVPCVCVCVLCGSYVSCVLYALCVPVAASGCLTTTYTRRCVEARELVRHSSVGPRHHLEAFVGAFCCWNRLCPRRHHIAATSLEADVA